MLLKSLLVSLLYLLLAYGVFRIMTKRDYERHSKLSPLSYSLEVLVFAIHANLLYLALPTPWPDFPPLPESTVIRITGALVFAFGAVILLLAWLRLGTKPSLGMDEGQLKTDGLYQYSRNPQLVGYGLILVAFGILYFSWFTILWIFLYLLTAYFMVQSEEEFLEQQYQDAYRSYCQEVPRVFKI